MASAIKYLANVTKSIKYATVDVIKDLNPVITDAIDTNEDVIKTTYSTIKNFQKVSEKTYTSIKDSQIVALASEGLKNTFEDLKNGTFYNRERIKKYEDEQINNFMNDSDFAFSFGDEDSGSTSSGDDFGNDFGMDDLADTIDSVGEKSSNAVSQVIIRGAEHTAKVNSRLANQIMAQNSAMIGAIHTDMSVVNTNLANILKFNTDIMSTHITNSTAFFNRQQDQMSEQTAILKEILDITKKKFGEEEQKATSSSIKIDELLSSEGNLNIQNYVKYVKQNIKNKDSGMGDMAKMMMEMGFGKTAMASPLSYVLRGAIKKLTPKVLKEALEELNATIGGISGNLILKANGLKNRTDFLSNIGDIFGVSQSYKTSFDTGKYKKTAMPWSGEDHKALTEVIPTYLSKIYNSISGKDETRFDYETGKYLTERQIRDQWKTKRLRDSMKSHGDFSDEMVRAIRERYSDDSDRQRELINTLNAVFEDDLKNARVFNPRNKDATASTYSLKGGKKDEINLKILMQLAQTIPNYQKLIMGQASAMLSTIADNNREMEKLQESGSSIYNSLFNDSFGQEKKSASSKDAKAAPVFDLSPTNQYLFNINKEVAYIRTLLTGGGYGSGASGKKIPNPPTGGSGPKKRRRKKSKIPSFDEFTFYGNAIPEAVNTNNDDDDISVITDDLDKKDAENAKTGEKKKFLDKMVEANNLTDKMSVIIHGVDDLVKSPAKLLAGVIKKADDRVYKLLFGEKDYNNGESIMENLKNSLNTWLDNTLKAANEKIDKFGKMLEDKFSAERRKEFFEKLKKMFHIDTKDRSFKDFLFGENDDGWGTNIVNMFKKGFGEEKDDVVDAFKTAKSDTGKIFGATKDGVKNTSGVFKDKFNKSQEEKEKAENKKYEDLFNSLNDDDKAARGMRRVSKTGLVAVSEGEMIIPPDMNPYNISKREKNEQKSIDAFRKKFGNRYRISKFATGTSNVNSDDITNEKLTNEKVIRMLAEHRGDVDWLIEQLEDDEFKRIFNIVRRTETGKILVQPFMDSAERLKNRKKRRMILDIDDYEENQAPFMMRMKNSVKMGAKGAVDAIKETKTYEDIMNRIKDTSNDMKFKQVIDDTKNNFDKLLPGMAAGGVTGAALSGILGLVGGPILGAAGGIALSLIKNSNKIQETLFGDIITDEDGNKSRDYNSGILPAQISQAIDKYAKSMGAGAIVGGITSFLPFIPASPVTGIIVGSALGFAKENDEIKKKLFGEDTFLGKLSQLVKKNLPRATFGAIGGLSLLSGTAMPGGIVTKIVLGSALGIATDTAKFKEFLFGKKGFDDKRRGGVAGLIKEQFDRFTGFAKELMSTFRKDFLEKEILSPIKRFFNPLKQQGINIVSMMTRTMKDHIWKPVGTYLHKALTGSETLIGKVLFGTKKAREKHGTGNAGIVGLAKNVVTSPFKVAGKAGDVLRRHQLNTGGANDLSAEERLAERDRLFSNGKIRGWFNKKTGGNMFNPDDRQSWFWQGVDKSLADMNADQAKDVAMAARTVAMSDAKSMNKQIYSVFGKKPIDKLKAHFAANELTSKQYNAIVNAVKSGNTKVIEGYINQSEIPEDYKPVAIKQLTEAANKIKNETDQVNTNFGAYKQAAINALNAVGIQAGTQSSEAMFRLADYAEAQANFRTGDEDIKTKKELDEEKQKESPIFKMVDGNFKSIFDRLDQILVRMDPTYKPIREQFALVPYTGNAENNTKEPTTDYMDLTSTTTLDTLNNLTNKKPDKKKNNGLIEKITANGKIMRFTRDRMGRLTPSHSDPDTRLAVQEQEEQESTQKGILDKISSLASGFKEKFGGNEKEEKKQKGSIFSSLFSMIFGNGIAKKILTGGATLLGLGLLGHKVQVKQKDANGNVMYDADGNPIMVESTIANVIESGVKKIWLGSDGTGETNGIWHGIKEYAPSFITQMGENISNVLGEYAPKLVELICEQLPTYIAAALKGTWNGVKKWAEGLLTGSKKTTEANSQSNIEKSYNTISTSGAIINSETVQSSTNKAIDEDTVNKMRNSTAFKNTNQNEQDKAIRVLGGVWDEKTNVDGKTVGEVLNDDKTVLATIQDENGQSIDITGANLLQYASYYPGLSQQILGVDLNLSESDRDAYTEDMGDRHNKGGILNKIKRGTINVLRRGGSANPVALKTVEGVSSLLGKGLKHVPLVGKYVSPVWQTVNTAPLSTVRKINDFVYDTAHSGISSAVTNFKNETLVKKTSESKNALQKLKDWYSPRESVAAAKAATSAGEATSAVTEMASTASSTLATKAQQAEKVVNNVEKTGKLSKITDGIKKFFTDNSIVKKISQGLADHGIDLSNVSMSSIMEDIAVKISEKFLNKSPEVAAKIGEKVAANATVILLVANALASFANGMLEATVILKIEKPSFLFKVLAGLVNALNQTFFFGVIETGDIWDFLWKLLCKLFPALEDSDYQKKRDEYTEKVKEYNDASGENLTEEEYARKTNKWVQFKDKIWNSRALSPITGTLNGVGNVVGGVASGAVNIVKGIGSGVVKTVTENPWEGIKAVGSGLASGVKSVGSGLVNGVKSIGNGFKTFFTGKKSQAYESDATKQRLSTSTSDQMQQVSDNTQAELNNANTSQYVTDSNGNIVGSGINADGTISSMYIPQGDAAESSVTYDQNGLPTQLISDSNQQLLQQATSDVNNSIPSLVVAFKNKIANLFGVSTSDNADLKTNLVSLARAAVRNVAKSNPAYLFFKGINSMWKTINKNTSDMQETMPDQIQTAATAAANMAQTSVLGGTLGEVVNAGTDNKKQSLQDAITDLAVNNTKSSLGLTIFKKGSNLVKKISSGIKKLFSGKGSGLDDQVNVDENQDPTVASFISQKSSEYSSMKLGAASGKESVKDAGCAPASATMAINANPMAGGYLSMPDAIKHASPYVQDDGGVSADYFAQEFAAKGMTPVYITPVDNNYKDTIISQLRNSNTVVLMGQDPSNRSKKQSPFGPNGHYVVAVGISPDGKTIYINDPESDTARVPYDINRVLDSSLLAIIPTNNKSTANSNMLDRVKKALRQFHGMASETDSTKGGWLSGTTTKVSTITDALGAFDELAQYYGLNSSSNSTSSTDTSSTTSSSNIDTSSISGNVSSDPEIATKQKALVAKMESVQGQLKYAQNNAQFPGSRNPDDGSGDCSSTVQWAYKAVTGVDPGSWTGAMQDSPNTYTVTNSLADESKLQLGDILLKDGHVEMYAGNGQMIGHGGGADGKTPGPTMKALGATPPYNIVRRLNDFRGAGSGVFVSQTDSKYKYKSMGNETVNDSGCAPAAATMAANLVLDQNQKKLNMNDAIRFSQNYVSPSGVSADYFVKQFEARGLSSMVISGKDTSTKILNLLKGKSGAIVLLGRNPNNKSKSKSPFGPTAHYVVATAISRDGKTIYINDPEAKKENILYAVSDVLPYVSLGIMPSSKGNKILDKASAKLSKVLSKLSGKGNYDSSSPEYITWNYLRANGFSEHAAAGVMGNIQQESSFDIGSSDGNTNGGTGAHGLFQWQGDRYTELVQFAKEHGTTWDDLGIQLDYFLQEFGGYDYWFRVQNTAYDSVEAFKQSTNYIDAASSFELAFERASTPMMDKRIAYAKDFLESFTGSSIDEKAIAAASQYKNGSSGSSTTTDDDTVDGWYNSLVNTLNGSASITDVYTAFDKLAQYYGLSSTSNSSSSSSTLSSSSASGTGKVTAQQYLDKFNSWNYAVRGSDKHHEIIDTYNNHAPDGAYKLSYDDPWCQATATAADTALDDNAVANTASTPTAVNYYKTNNQWHPVGESGFTPQPGDQVYYSYDGDETPDHVGAVFTGPGSDGMMKTIEGNWGNMVQKRDVSTSDSNILGYGRPIWSGSGKGSGLLARINRFRENPKPISSFKISGKGSETPIYNNTKSNSKTLTTPNLSDSYKDSETKSVHITQKTQTKQSDDISMKLMNIVVQLLTKVVDNTTSIKDIAALLTEVFKDNKSDSGIGSSTKMVDSEARALLLRNMKNANSENTSLEQLIANVEAIVQQ